MLERVKEKAPGTRMIVTTGFGTVEMAVHAMREGAADFVLKPYSVEYLLHRIREVLSGSGKNETKGAVS